MSAPRLYVRLSAVLDGRTLPEAIELVERKLRELEAEGKRPSNRLIRLGKYLYWQHRLFTGTAVADFSEESFGTLKPLDLALEPNDE